MKILNLDAGLGGNIDLIDDEAHEITNIELDPRHNMVGYIDGALVQRIVFLTHFFKGNWVIENVVPYYKPYGNPVKIGRHLFWSNYKITPFETPKQPKNFINEATVSEKKMMQDWLGIHYPENIYYGNNHCPAQILRNCVHPIIGKTIFDQQFI